MSKKPSRFAVSKGLQAVDLFQDSVHLNVGGEQSLKTSLGGLLSILIIALLTVQATLQTVSIINRENPNIVQMKAIEDDPLLISLNKTNNFIFALGATQDNVNINMSNSSAISFVAEYSHQMRDKQGNITKQKASILWAPCVEANFSSGVFPENTFSSYSLKYAYCPTMMNFTNKKTGICPQDIKAEYPNCMTPFEFSLQGNYLSFDFRYLQVSVHSCNTNDAPTIKDLNCSLVSENDTFTNSEIKINLYYTSTLVDPVDYQTPNKTYLDTIYWSVHPSVNKLADIYMDTITVQDNDDLVSHSLYSNRSFFSLDIDNMRETQVFHRTEMLEINLRRSNSNTILIRRYSKLLDVVSSIGGISKVLLVIGAVIALGYSRYKHQMILSNKLYDFQPKNTTLKRSKTSMYAKSGAKLKKQLAGLDLENSKSSLKKDVVIDDDYMNDNFGLHKKGKRKLQFKVANYLKSLMKGFVGKGDLDEELAQKARIQVTQDLDIVKIVEKLKEVDKLKLILLNRHQREAFNFIDRPLISLKNENPMHRDSVGFRDNRDGASINASMKDAMMMTKQEYDSMSKYSRLYMAYTHLKDEKDERNRGFNNRILNLIGQDLMRVFQRVDERLGENPDPKKFEEALKKLVMGESITEIQTLTDRKTFDAGV